MADVDEALHLVAEVRYHVVADLFKDWSFQLDYQISDFYTVFSLLSVF